MASLISTASFRAGAFLMSARIRPTTSPARFPSLTIRESTSSTSRKFGGSALRKRRAANAYVTAAVIGWFTSWVIEAVNWPIVATRLACASSSCASRYRCSFSRASAFYCPQCRNIGAGAAITAEFSFGVKHWLAADFIINHRSVAMRGPVDKIAERLTRLEHRPMKLPLFRLRLDVRCEFPSRHPNPAHSRDATSETSFVLREACEFVIRIGFPVPIGGAFRVVAEFRFAFPQCFLGALAVLDVVGGPVPLNDLAVIVARSDTIDGEPAILSVGTPDALLGMPRLAGGKGVAPHFITTRGVVGMRHDGPFRATRSLVGKARVVFPGGVDEVAPGVYRIARYWDWNGIDHLPQLASRFG